jgi:hypothetical protein
MEDGFDSQPVDTGSAVYTGAVHRVDGQRSFTVRAVARGSGKPRWRRDLPTSPTFGVRALLSVANEQVLSRSASTRAEIAAPRQRQASDPCLYGCPLGSGQVIVVSCR